MYEWSWGIFAKKSELHDAGGPDTVVSPRILLLVLVAPSEWSPPSSVSISQCLPGNKLPIENIANKIMTSFNDIIVQSALIGINLLLEMFKNIL